jgi:hypothetical protein
MKLLMNLMKNDPELFAEARAFVLRRVVGADVAHAGDRLVDPIRHAAHLPDPLLGELVDLTLQPRDHADLHGIERDRGEAENRILDEHEREDRQQRAALKSRQGEGIADEASERLHLGVDHLDDLARRHAAELGQREAQHP